MPRSLKSQFTSASCRPKSSPPRVPLHSATIRLLISRIARKWGNIWTREQSQLWQKIRDFELDDPSASVTFTERLARENDWSLGFADRVVQEYKRFIFLAATAAHQLTPSDAVDQAWHLHLIYTRSYWDDLCRGVLGRPIHHGPTKGGRTETARFGDQYKQTLASYREAFDEEPPRDIWPLGTSKSGRKPRHKRVNVVEVVARSKAVDGCWRRSCGEPSPV